MYDAKADEVELSINGRDFSIQQSPGVLQSRREGGTTGAAVWRACVLFAEWLSWSNNPLFKHGILDSTSKALELGTGISGLVPLVLSSRVQRVIATDQQYALKLLQRNVESNLPVARGKSTTLQVKTSNIDILPLDWETDDITSFLISNGLQNGVDAVLVCDCVFNYALIKPLVDTCAEMCRVRSNFAGRNPFGQTMCIVAQQLRQPDVFEQWLKAFMVSFRVWRVPDELLTAALKAGCGYVVHIGVLRRAEG